MVFEISGQAGFIYDSLIDCVDEKYKNDLVGLDKAEITGSGSGLFRFGKI